MKSFGNSIITSVYEKLTYNQKDRKYNPLDSPSHSDFTTLLATILLNSVTLTCRQYKARRKRKQLKVTRELRVTVGVGNNPRVG